jgi:hypothetical protein
MADFCRQCSVSVLGIDDQDYFGDLSGLISEEEVKTGLGACVICEGCGFVRVDHTGKCLGGPDCMEGHPEAKLGRTPSA